MADLKPTVPTVLYRYIEKVADDTYKGHEFETKVLQNHFKDMKEFPSFTDAEMAYLYQLYSDEEYSAGWVLISGAPTDFEEWLRVFLDDIDYEKPEKNKNQVTISDVKAYLWDNFIDGNILVSGEVSELWEMLEDLEKAEIEDGTVIQNRLLNKYIDELRNGYFSSRNDLHLALSANEYPNEAERIADDIQSVVVVNEKQESSEDSSDDMKLYCANGDPVKIGGVYWLNNEEGQKLVRVDSILSCSSGAVYVNPEVINSDLVVGFDACTLNETFDELTSMAVDPEQFDSEAADEIVNQYGNRFSKAEKDDLKKKVLDKIQAAKDYNTEWKRQVPCKVG